MVTVHDYAASVRNPLFRFAEDSVAVTLIRMGWQLENNRDANKHIDFYGNRFGHRVSIDVKYDRYIDTSHNVPFEETLEWDDGYKRQSWGWDTDLHFLAVTGTSLTEVHIVLLPLLRDHVKARRAPFGGEASPCEWVHMHPYTVRDGRGFHAFGWAIPIAELPDGVITAVVPLVHVE